MAAAAKGNKSNGEGSLELSDDADDADHTPTVLNPASAVKAHRRVESDEEEGDEEEESVAKPSKSTPVANKRPRPLDESSDEEEASKPVASKGKAAAVAKAPQPLDDSSDEEEASKPVAFHDATTAKVADKKHREEVSSTDGEQSVDATQAKVIEAEKANPNSTNPTSADGKAHAKESDRTKSLSAPVLQKSGLPNSKKPTPTDKPAGTGAAKPSKPTPDHAESSNKRKAPTSTGAAESAPPSKAARVPAAATATSAAAAANGAQSAGSSAGPAAEGTDWGSAHGSMMRLSERGTVHFDGKFKRVFQAFTVRTPQDRWLPTGAPDESALQGTRVTHVRRSNPDWPHRARPTKRGSTFSPARL